MPSAAEGREARLARAGEIADLIESKNYQEAANLIRPAGTLSSGSDYLPEAIGRFMDDRRISDRGSLIALVEDVIMGHYPKTVIPDMESLGYKVNEQALNMASTGCHAYAKQSRRTASERNTAYTVARAAVQKTEKRSRWKRRESGALFHRSRSPVPLGCPLNRLWKTLWKLCGFNATEPR